MSLFGYSNRTKTCYIDAVSQLYRYYRAPLLNLIETDIKLFLLYKQHKGYASSSMRILCSGIRFFYTHVLRSAHKIENIPNIKIKRGLPNGLSTSEMERLIACSHDILTKTMIMCFYATGRNASGLTQVVSLSKYRFRPYDYENSWKR